MSNTTDPANRGETPAAQSIRLVCLLSQKEYKPGDPAPSGYLAWHEWAEVQHKAGLRQKQCCKCGLWKYPQELSASPAKWPALNRQGKRVEQSGPVCLKCAPQATPTSNEAPHDH